MGVLRHLAQHLGPTWFCVVACTGLLAGGHGCDGRNKATERPDSIAQIRRDDLRHETLIRPPPVPRGVAVDMHDHHGAPVTLSCQSCHTARRANEGVGSSAELDEFHQGLPMSHGRLTCASCHNPADGYASLRLADGRAIGFGDSMKLCAQCHGTQFRDYQHGAHGGMHGHWDLARGGRQRNHCLHCHDAHAPEFPMFLPAPAPHDRFPPADSGAPHE